MSFHLLKLGLSRRKWMHSAYTQYIPMKPCVSSHPTNSVNCECCPRIGCEPVPVVLAWCKYAKPFGLAWQSSGETKIRFPWPSQRQLSTFNRKRYNPTGNTTSMLTSSCPPNSNIQPEECGVETTLSNIRVVIMPG